MQKYYTQYGQMHGGLHKYRTSGASKKTLRAMEVAVDTRHETSV